MKGKRGLSTIIVTLIIVLLSLVAVGIIWVIIRNVIQNNTEEINLGKLTLNTEISNVYLDNSSNNVSLTVKRNVGEGELSGIKFIFSSSSGKEVITEEILLNQLESRRFYFHLSQINVSQLTSIVVIPVMKSDGKEILGSTTSTYNVGSGGGSSGGTL